MDWAYSGVNHSVPRNAGPECADFLPASRRHWETAVVLAAATLALAAVWRRLQVPDAKYERRDRGGRRLLLVLMSLIWGMEIGYKFSSSTVIYLLNPCHIVTAIQQTVLVWAYSGVNHSVPRNAGPECADFLPASRRHWETAVVLAAATLALAAVWRRLQVPDAKYERRDRGGRRLLLVLMSLIWGMEIGYKFSSSTVIYLLNPCHIVTAIQIYLLAASPNSVVTAVFRIHLNFLNGPLLAFIFPETDSRILPLEASIYWIQHGMMFVVPYYLLRLGGVYNVENLSDFSWNIAAYSMTIIYHFAVLQAIGIPTQVNLNHMLCPAILDPFGGPYYRIFAVIHQAILCPLMCKLFCIVSAFFLTSFGPTKIKKTLCCDVALPMPLTPVTNGEPKQHSNGHSHVD